ncbi:MAG TPA: glycosyltransferase family 4 protein [Candidatus Dormibacteraeota bacterium]|nr:glycosyltransferase family 4 protein [Candidatus Dormibacteraeota bacterium]
MRFLLLTQYFAPEVGAPQVRLLALVQQLRERGHQVTVVTAMPNYPEGVVRAEYRRRRLVREEVDGIPVIRTWIYAASGANVVRRMAGYLSFCATSLVGCLLAPRPDYVLVESPPLFLGGTAYLVSRLRRAPYVMIVSDLWPASARDLGIITNRQALWLAERLERFLYRKACRVAGVTRGICGAVSETVAAAAVTFLPNGVDTAAFHPFEGGSSGLLRPGEVGFLYAGTHGYAQGLDVMLEAAELLRARREIVLVLVGDGPEKARLVEAARDRSLTNVRFADPRPAAAMPPLFSEARASIVPLLDRPLFRGARPSKIFPSLACGTPVIYSGAGEAAELIEDSGAGLVVPPERPEQLAAAIRRLADDPRLAVELGAAGRRLVERDYSWSAIAERWLAELPVRGVSASARSA